MAKTIGSLNRRLYPRCKRNLAVCGATAVEGNVVVCGTTAVGERDMEDQMPDQLSLISVWPAIITRSDGSVFCQEKGATHILVHRVPHSQALS
jgi:hypothetical protein